MIIDKIENASLYAGISEGLANGLAILQDVDLTKPQDVKYEEDDFFYMIQKYKTEPATEKKLEAHKQYIDIQYVVIGEEIICK